MTVFPSNVITTDDLRALECAVDRLELAWREKESVRQRAAREHDEARRLKARRTWYGKESE